MLHRVLEPEAMDTAEEARDYDSMDHAGVNRIFVTDFLFAAAAAELPIDDREPAAGAGPSHGTSWVDILDLGAGTAQIPIELCRRASSVRVVAVDMAAEMLEVARINVALAGLVDRIRLDRQDAKRLQFPDNQFAAVISNSIVHHIPEPAAALAEAVRVTRGGGLLFFRDLLRPENDKEVRRLVDLYADGANANQQGMFEASLRAALSLDEVTALVAKLGFSGDSVAATSDRHWTWSACKRSESDK